MLLRKTLMQKIRMIKRSKMKHLVLILAVFLLMGNQALAQNETPQKLPENFVNFTMIQKPVICGPTVEVLEVVVGKFGEKLMAGWINSTTNYKSMFYANIDEETTTVVEEVQPGWLCVTSSGINAAIIFPNKKKDKGMPIRYLTY